MGDPVLSEADDLYSARVYALCSDLLGELFNERVQSEIIDLARINREA